MKKKVIGIIPARYASTRFPGKPLALIKEKPMIQWVYEASEKAVDELYVATDDRRIFDVVHGFGGKAIMTGECSCGTERVFNACRTMDYDIVLNIQGDEPLLKKGMLQDLILAFEDPSVQMATLKRRIKSKHEFTDHNVVKVVTKINGDALYFSRSAIPYDRDEKWDEYYFAHIGLYGFRKGFLEVYVNLKQSSLEKSEKLEQLRILENNYNIRVVETQYQSIGVDTPEDLDSVERYLV